MPRPSRLAAAAMLAVLLLFAPLLCVAQVSSPAAVSQISSQASAPQASAQAKSEAGAVNSTDGPVSIVVFSDFQCPYSSALFFNLQAVQRRYPNQLQIIYKQSPLSIHPDAPTAHRAALAAGRQGKFNEMAELLYSNETRQDLPSLLAYAHQLHLDPVRFRRDLDSPVIAAELAADMQESRAFGVDQTPTLFYRGKTLTGFQDEKVLTAILSEPGRPAVAADNQSDSPRLESTLEAEIRTAPLAELGAADAPLTIVEFTDFQCPFCKSAVPPMEQFMDTHGREVRWVYRAFPLDFHPDSELATEAALAAGEQGKFWPMHDLLFQHQTALKLTDLRSYAQSLNLDMKRFDQAVSTHKFAGQIAADRALGLRAGVQGTPTFFIDGQAMTGARNVAELNMFAETHLANRLAGVPLQAAVRTPPSSLPDQQVAGLRPAAPLTVTWFADVRSPLAARQGELIRSLAKRYDGKIRVLFRAFALETRPDSRIGGAALIAALKISAAANGNLDGVTQDSFWKMYDALAQRRDTLDQAKILSIADGLGLPSAAFSAALDTSADDVTLDMSDATRRGIQGAPVLFLNEQRVDGLQIESNYVSILDQQLRSMPRTQASLQR